VAEANKKKTACSRGCGAFLLSGRHSSLKDCEKYAKRHPPNAKPQMGAPAAEEADVDIAKVLMEIGNVIDTDTKWMEPATIDFGSLDYAVAEDLFNSI
jgi:hypothetical protein